MFSGILTQCFDDSVNIRGCGVGVSADAASPAMDVVEFVRKGLFCADLVLVQEIDAKESAWHLSRKKGIGTIELVLAVRIDVQPHVLGASIYTECRMLQCLRGDPAILQSPPRQDCSLRLSS